MLVGSLECPAHALGDIYGSPLSKLLSWVTYTSERIMSASSTDYVAEILVRFSSCSVPDGLRQLEDSQSTFLLFERWVQEAYELLQNVWYTGVHINAYASDFLHAEFLDVLRKTQEAYPWISPSSITIELLESDRYMDYAKLSFLAERLRQAKAMWYKIALDDFIIDDFGYKDNWSVAYSLVMEDEACIPDYIKIDGKWIRKLLEEPPDSEEVADFQLFVKEFHKLGVSIVAEWVRDKTEITIASWWWCDFFQGRELSI